MLEEEAGSDFLGIFAVALIVFAVLYVLRQYIKDGQFTEKVSGRGLVAIVTGASSGIGRELVRELNLRYVKVYMLCRDVDKGRRVARELFSRYGCDTTRMIVMECDLTKFESVRNFVQEFDKLEDKLDILINNAGVMLYPRYEVTVDGHELVWQSNYLGHFLLTELLLEKLERSTYGGRIINQSSRLHLNADSVEADVISSKRRYDRFYKTYARSKLAQVMHAVALTKRIRSKNSSSKLCINACHPGSVNTDLVRVPIVRHVLKKIFSPFVWFFLKTAQDGAQTALYLALSKKINGISGKYFSDCKLADVHTMAKDENACEVLYNESIESCHLQNTLY